MEAYFTLYIPYGKTIKNKRSGAKYPIHLICQICLINLLLFAHYCVILHLPHTPKMAAAAESDRSDACFTHPACPLHHGLTSSPSDKIRSAPEHGRVSSHFLQRLFVTKTCTRPCELYRRGTRRMSVTFRWLHG